MRSTETCEAQWSAAERSGAGAGDRTLGFRCGAPVCHRNTSPAWRPRPGSGRNLGVEPAWAPGARPLILRGSGGNRTHVSRCKKPVHNHSATNPPRSHPLESNQNLSGFSRARRPTTLGRDVCAARFVVARRGFRCPCRGTHHSLFGCQRCAAARTGRTSGLDASADSASAPVATPDLDYRSRFAKLVVWGAG